MVRPIVKDKFLLSQRSAPADRSDLPTAQDMVETIAAHAEECVGMAANMIGVLKRIIVFQDVNKYVVMLNPEVKWASPETYTIKEGCLCHEGAQDVAPCGDRGGIPGSPYEQMPQEVRWNNRRDNTARA